MSRGSTGGQVRPFLLGEGWPPDSSGGLNRYFGDLVTALREAGVAVQAVVVGPAADAPPDVAVVSDAAAPLQTRLRAVAVAADTAARASSVIDTHFALYAYLPSWRRSSRRAARVVHFHGPWSDESRVAGDESSLATFGKRLIERRVYRRADAVVTLSSAFRQVVVQRYGVSPWRVHVIPPAVDLERFAPGDRTVARARLGIPADTCVVVCIRRLVPRMGIDDLLRAWSALGADDGRPRLLLIGGDGPSRAELEATAASAGAADTVRFLGGISEEDLVAAYQAADLSVVPSVALEGFGLVVLEALACGTPVITTDVGGLPEAVAGLSPDAVVPASQPDVLAERLGEALGTRSGLPDRESCRRYAERFSRPALAKAHLDLYSRAADGEQRDGRIRVVYLDHCALLSGAEIALLRLLAGMPNVHAHVILAEDGPLVGQLNRAGISVEVLPLDSAARDLKRDRVGSLPMRSAAHTAAYVARLARRLRQLRPDIVHCNSLKACLYGTAAARTVGLPVVWHARDRMASDYLPDKSARVVRTAFRALPSVAVANSAATLDTLGPPRRGRLDVVIPDTFRRRRPVTDPPAGALRVGIVGRLAPWKGQDVVLAAFAEAFPDGAERCIVVGSAMFGEDEYAAGLATQAQTLGVADRVELLGFRDDVESEIDRLHVLVHASVVPEPFGQVVVEGMAAGRAVVAAGAGGPAEIITDGQDGLLCPPGDVHALAAALRRLADDPALRSRLAAAALRRAADFDPNVVAPAVEAVYRQVLDGR